MIKSKAHGGDASAAAIFLVLQGAQGFWFKYQGGEYVDSFVDQIDDDPLMWASRCPWITTDSGQTDLPVHLILNTLMDELDPVMFEGRSNVIFRYINRYLHVSKLRRTHTQASIYTLPKENFPQVANLLHHVIPDHWNRWLVELQKQRVLIMAVATATELLAEWSRSVEEPLLLDLPLGGERRHLLVANGTPVFMRFVSDGSSVEMEQVSAARINNLVETLALVRESELYTEERLRVAEIHTANASPSVEWGNAQTLSAAMAGAKIFLKICEEERLTDENNPGSLLEYHERQSRDFSLASKAVATIIRPFKSLCCSGANRLHRPVSRWNPMRYAWLNARALASSHQQLKTLAKVNHLKVITVAFAVFGFLLMFAATVYGIGGAISRDKLIAHRKGNEDQSVNLIQEARSVHASPEHLARSISMIDQFQSTATVRPDFVVSIVAQAISTVPALSLERLAWKAINDNEYYDELISSVDRAEARSHYWSEGAAGDRVRVEVSGNITGKDLSAQKLSLDDFVKALQGIHSVSHVEVVESPVDSASSSERLSGHTSYYRVSLDLSAG